MVMWQLVMTGRPGTTGSPLATDITGGDGWQVVVNAGRNLHATDDSSDAPRPMLKAPPWLLVALVLPVDWPQAHGNPWLA